MKQIYNRRLAVALMCLFFVAMLSSSFTYSYDYVTQKGLTYMVWTDDDGSRYAEVYSCSGGGHISIPNYLEKLGKQYKVIGICSSAFRDCDQLISIRIPNSVTKIGSGAFYYCSRLEAVFIPNSVEQIGYNPFVGCNLMILDLDVSNPYFAVDGYLLYSKDKKKLVGCFNKNVESSDLEIPNSVTEIGINAFRECTGLTSVEIPNSVTEIGSNAFEGCTGLTSVVIPNSVTKIEFKAFYGCTGLTSVVIGNSVTEIGYEAFYGCTGLTSVEIPNSVTEIGINAFEGCTGLTSVAIGNSVTEIRSYAFYECTSLTSVEIPNSVTKIGFKAFSECTGLTSVVLGNSVTEIEDYVFLRCPLEYIDCMSVNPPPFEVGFNDFYKKTTLYVPKGSLSSYKSTWPWRNFANIQEKDFSGIGDVEADAMEVTVSVNGGRITVSGVADGSDIEVFDMAGRRVYAGTESSVGGLSSGAYVVRVSGQPYKVMVR